MTHENNQNPDDFNWMDIAREDAVNDVRHSGQRLPFIAAAVSLLIIGGGALFAQTSTEAPAQAEEISVVQTSQTPSAVGDPVISAQSTAAPSAAATAIGASAIGSTTITPAVTPGGIPVIPNVAPKVNGYYEDSDDHEDEDYEDDHEEDDDHDEDEDDD